MFVRVMVVENGRYITPLVWSCCHVALGTLWFVLIFIRLLCVSLLLVQGFHFRKCTRDSVYTSTGQIDDNSESESKDVSIAFLSSMSVSAHFFAHQDHGLLWCLHNRNLSARMFCWHVFSNTMDTSW